MNRLNVCIIALAIILITSFVLGASSIKEIAQADPQIEQMQSLVQVVKRNTEMLEQQNKQIITLLGRIENVLVSIERQNRFQK